MYNIKNKQLIHDIVLERKIGRARKENAGYSRGFFSGKSLHL
jgi:hypothetical protein